MAIEHDLRHFKRSEFKHSDQVNWVAAGLLDELREQVGFPLVVTDDARLPGEEPPGSAGNASLHHFGQAFDLRTKDLTAEQMFKLINSACLVALWVARGQKSGVEIEVVSSATDHHFHIGFFLGARSFNTLIIRAE